MNYTDKKKKQNQFLIKHYTMDWLRGFTFEINLYSKAQLNVFYVHENQYLNLKIFISVSAALDTFQWAFKN